MYGHLYPKFHAIPRSNTFSRNQTLPPVGADASLLQSNDKQVPFFECETVKMLQSVIMKTIYSVTFEIRYLNYFILVIIINASCLSFVTSLFFIYYVGKKSLENVAKDTF